MVVDPMLDERRWLSSIAPSSCGRERSDDPPDHTHIKTHTPQSPSSVRLSAVQSDCNVGKRGEGRAHASSTSTPPQPPARTVEEAHRPAAVTRILANTPGKRPPRHCRTSAVQSSLCRCESTADAIRRAAAAAASRPAGVDKLVTFQLSNGVKLLSDTGGVHVLPVTKQRFDRPNCDEERSPHCRRRKKKLHLLVCGGNAAV